MAPLGKSKGWPRSDNQRTRGGSARATGRGLRSRGRRGDRSSWPRGGAKSSFKSTRIAEQEKDISDRSEEFSKQDTGLETSSDELSSDEGNAETAVTPIKPYNVLLQSFNHYKPPGEPPRKRQKQSELLGFEEIDVTKSDLDLVMESEESNDLGVDELIYDDGDEADEGHDPFLSHLANRDESEFAHNVDDVKNNKWTLSTTTLEPGWSALCKVPASSKESSLSRTRMLQNAQIISLKKKLQVPAARLLPNFDQVLGGLASSIFGYQDLLFSQRSLENAEDLRNLACLHALNHVFKTRDRIIKNNARNTGEGANEDVETRDQGFTRPKVLIILPTRQSCARYVDTIISLAEPEQQENKKRFHDSYVQGEDGFSEDKPEDFRDLFSGNDDDMFRLGLKFTRKTVKYFSQFYNSDIIFASPLGLRMALGAENSKQQDYDFLSSIEIVVVDQCDALVMQNWEHIEYIFEHLNLQPKAAHDCNFSRVRNWYLDNNARYLRQTITFSAYNFPSLNGLYTRHMLNVAGKTKFQKQYEGAMLDLSVQVKQTFSRYNTVSPFADPDDRFNYFTTAVVPSLTKHARASDGVKQGILIYLPMYADFVRVRNFLSTSPSAQNISFGSISEYTSHKDVARARSHFFSGRHSILLYTDRAHHFRRYRLKGVKSIIMYGLPENPLFYKETVGGYLAANIADVTMDTNVAGVRTLFSRFDILKLERVVGTMRYKALVHDKNGDTFDFV